MGSFVDHLSLTFSIPTWAGGGQTERREKESDGVDKQAGRTTGGHLTGSHRCLRHFCGDALCILRTPLYWRRAALLGRVGVLATGVLNRREQTQMNKTSGQNGLVRVARADDLLRASCLVS